MAGITGPAIRNVDLTKPNPAQPLDFVAEQAQLAQASALAQALMAQQFQQDVPAYHTSPGNPFAIDVPNIGGPINKVVDAMRARQQMEETLRQQQQLELATQARTKSEVGEIVGHLQGGPPTEGVGPPTPEGEPPPMMPGKAPDYYAALRAASSGTTPTAQALGKKLAEGIPTPADFLNKGADFAPGGLGEFQRTGDPTKLAGRPKITVENGVLYTTQDGEKKKVEAGEHWGPVKEVAPGIAGQTMTETGKVAFAPTGTVPASRERILAEADADTLKKGYASYLQNISRTGTILQLQKDIEQISDENFGVGAYAKNVLNKALEAIGGKKLDSTAGIETVKSELGKLMLGGELKQLYPVTDTDIKIIQNIVGTEGMTKRSLTRIMEILNTSVQREMQVHTNFLKNYPLPESENRQMFIDRYAPSYEFKPVPTLPGATPPGGNPLEKMTNDELQKYLDDLREKKRMRR